MTPAAVLWDIDGTLIDSEPLHQRALQRVCDKYHVDISDLHEDTFVGVNMLMVWEALSGRYPANLKRQQWLNEINEEYCNRADQLEEISGASDIVETLHLRGVRQAAVSNSNRVIVDVNLHRLAITKHLEFSLSLDDVLRPKPDPTPYQHALKLMGIEPGKAIAVEDSQSGASSAKAANIFTISYRNDSINADRTIFALEDVADHFQQEGNHGL